MDAESDGSYKGIELTFGCRLYLRFVPVVPAVVEPAPGFPLVSLPESSPLR